MKRITCLILITAVLLSGCDKNNSITMSKGLTGTWELTKTYGAWGGTHEYAPGNGNTLTFTTTTYTRQYKNADTSYAISGDYIIHYGKPCADSFEGSIINFDTTIPSDQGLVISIVNGILTIETPPCFIDGSSGTYRKIAN